MVKSREIFGGLGNNMFQMAYIYAQFQRGELPDIYLQDEKYFASVGGQIKQWYRTGIGEPIDMVGIHVRRTDYVNNPFYVDLMETDYYERAMSEFINGDFIVFSDDIEWCKKQEIFKDCEFSHGTETEDLNTMASCKGIIMANSSFSWWGAYLSNAKIIAPKQWYTDGIERTVCPKQWKRI